MGPGSVLRHRHSTSEGVPEAAQKPFFAGAEKKKPQISAVSEGAARDLSGSVGKRTVLPAGRAYLSIVVVEVLPQATMTDLFK